jgi:hypothetical protein
MGLQGMHFQLLNARAGRVVVLSVTLLAGLTACGILMENEAIGPIAMAEESGEVRLVVCVDTLPVTVSASERPPDEAWNEFLDTTEEVRFRAGDDLLRDGGESAAWPSLDPGDYMLVQLVDQSVHEEVPRKLPPQAGFTVPADGMPVDGWLHPDGSVTEGPCPTP